MTDVLAMCRQLPELALACGERLIEEGVADARMYVLKDGAFEVLRGGVRVVVIDEPGAFIGEIAALLGTRPTATLVATRDSAVYVIEQAAAVARQQPDITYAIAQLLARRLSAVTAYLVDIKRQYGGENTHLAVMDQVLGSLMSARNEAGATGSERSDVPDY